MQLYTPIKHYYRSWHQMEPGLDIAGPTPVSSQALCLPPGTIICRCRAPVSLAVYFQAPRHPMAKFCVSNRDRRDWVRSQRSGNTQEPRNLWPEIGKVTASPKIAIPPSLGKLNDTGPSLADISSLPGPTAWHRSLRCSSPPKPTTRHRTPAAGRSPSQLASPGVCSQAWRPAATAALTRFTGWS